MKVEIDTADFARQIQQFIPVITAAVQSAIDDCCDRVVAVAQENCPVKTGNLRRSITSDTQSDGQTVRGIVGTTAEYAVYVHEGTGIHARKGDGRKQVPWAYEDPASGELVWTSGVHPTPFLEQAGDSESNYIRERFNHLFD